MDLLIKKIINGNHTSFEMVFKSWHKKVYAYFLKKTISKDLAYELTQLTFIKLWRFRHTLSQSCPIEAQLFRICRTVLLDFFKKREIEKRHHQNYVDSQPNAIEQNHSFDSVLQINHILTCLPPMRKRVFILHKLEGYSYKEISERLSISPRTVENHISLALKQLS